MSLVDIVIILIIFIAAYFSYQRGFLQQFSALAGLIVGLLIGARLSLLVSHHLQGSIPHLLSSVIITVAVCAVGLWLAVIFGKKLRVKVLATKWYMPDQYAGIIVGVLGSLLACWFVCSLVFSTNSATQQNTILSSKIFSFTADHSWFGESSYSFFYFLYPDHSLNVGQIVSGSGQPSTYDISVTQNFQGSFASALTKDYPSIVRIVRGGCYLKDTYGDGSGYIAFPHIVVTAAHVVAGSGIVQVETTKNVSYTGDVIKYDVKHDLAIIYVPDLSAPAITLDPTIQKAGEKVAIVGFPGDNPFEVNDGVIQAYGSYKGLSIDAPTLNAGKGAMFYKSSAAAFPGDSGGPMITESGSVIGHFTVYMPTDPSSYVTSDDNPSDIAYTDSVALSDYYQELLKSTHNIHRVSTDYCPDD